MEFHLFFITLLVVILVISTIATEGTLKYPLKVEKFTVDLSNQDRKHIHPDILDDAESTVHKIILDKNYQFSLQDGQPVLVNNHLQIFQCVECNITLVFEESFSKLPQLRSIVIRKNHLKAIHPDAFQHNAYLRTLDLRNNMLKSFNRMGILNHMRNLVTIQLSHNKFKLDVKYPILHIDFMVQFDCEACDISTIAPEAFGGIGRLYNLNLRNNSISKFNLTTPGLRTLDLSHNPMDLAGVELNQPDMETFSCDACASTAIDGRLFAKCKDLVTVNMRENKLQWIDDHAFRHNYFLQKLELDRNNLTRIPGKIIKMDSLKHLCFDYNPIEMLHDNWKLMKIYLIENQGHSCAVKKFNHPDTSLMHKIHPEEGMKILIVRNQDYRENPLNLANSNISMIFPHYFQEEHDTFTTLVMDDNNQFKFQPNIPFIYYELLEEFQCNRCGIDRIYEETFQEVPQLKRLELKHNQIKHLALASFRPNTALHTLTIDENPLQLLYGEASMRFSNLEVLLSAEETPDSVQKDPNCDGSLESLSCINCNLSIIHHNTFSCFPKIRMINLHGHNLQRFSKSVKLPSSIEKLNLLGNLTEFPTFLFDSNCKYEYLRDICVDYTLINVDEIVEQGKQWAERFNVRLLNMTCSDDLKDLKKGKVMASIWSALRKRYEKTTKKPTEMPADESIGSYTDNQKLTTPTSTTTTQETTSTELLTSEVADVERVSNDTIFSKLKSANYVKNHEEKTDKVDQDEETERKMFTRNAIYEETTSQVVKASLFNSGPSMTMTHGKFMLLLLLVSFVFINFLSVF